MNLVRWRAGWKRVCLYFGLASVCIVLVWWHSTTNLLSCASLFMSLAGTCMAQHPWTYADFQVAS